MSMRIPYMNFSHIVGTWTFLVGRDIYGNQLFGLPDTSSGKREMLEFLKGKCQV